MSDVVVTLNAGSSSIKFALFRMRGGGIEDEPLAAGMIEDTGGTPRLKVDAHDGAGAQVSPLAGGGGFEGLLQHLLGWIEANMAGHVLRAAGHRVVHGGAEFAAPLVVDAGILDRLEALAPLAPAHQPHNLAAIRALQALTPALPQVACFDTGFHQGGPALASIFALPHELTAAGVRRYGFHGLSYEYIASVLPRHAGAAAEGRVVVAHLGHGASMCAMAGRKSVATTMGMTALDGLPMGRRCGALDPGVVLYLMSQCGMTAEAVSELLYQRSGLLGVSGISDDMRVLLDSPAPRAREAVDLFTYQVSRHLGSLAAALGGLDVLVFTAGIGEHAAPVREAVCRRAAWLGVELDPEANRRGRVRISTAASRVRVLVIPTDENLMIARHTAALIAPATGRAAREGARRNKGTANERAEAGEERERGRTA